MCEVIRTILNGRTIVNQFNASTFCRSRIGILIFSGRRSCITIRSSSSRSIILHRISMRILLYTSIQFISRCSTNYSRINLIWIKIPRNFTSFGILPIICAIRILTSNINPMSIIATMTNVTKYGYVFTRIESRIHRIHITQFRRRTRNITDTIKHILRSHATFGTVTSSCIICRFARHTKHICHSCNATSTIGNIITITHGKIRNIRIILRHHGTMTDIFIFLLIFASEEIHNLSNERCLLLRFRIFIFR